MVGVILPILLLLYIFPNSPLRKIVETWIERRVAASFDEQMERFRHQLEIDADTIRADYQRRLHDASLYAVKRHEVFRELFKLILVADGAVGQLSGGRIVDTYEDYSLEDITQLMESVRFTGISKRYVIERWETDRPAAIREVQEAMRRVEKARAHQAVGAAWNYFLMSSLYLDDRVSDMVAEIFRNLRSNLAHALFPDERAGSEQIRLKREASELIERLKRALREYLETSTALPVPKRPSA